MIEYNVINQGQQTKSILCSVLKWKFGGLKQNTEYILEGKFSHELDELVIGTQLV